MKRILVLLAATVICGACMLTSCSTKDKKEQLLEVYDVHGSEGKARLTVNGKVLFTTDVYVGKHGIGKTREGDSMTPAGTFHPLTAFGVKPKSATISQLFIGKTTLKWHKVVWKKALNHKKVIKKKALLN